jgi:hypothetical protein
MPFGLIVNWRADFLGKTYFFEVQQPPLHSAFEADTSALTAQQFAPQLFAPSSQQSHEQASHAQTPVSQQQLPSGQQVLQAQVLAPVVEPELLA